MNKFEGNYFNPTKADLPPRPKPRMNNKINFQQALTDIMNNTRKELPFALTVKEVEKTLNFSNNKVMELIHSGELPARKIGGSWRIPRDQMIAWFYDEQVRGIESEVRI